MTGLSVISLGGSLIAPAKVDTAFVSGFHRLLAELAAADRDRRFIVVCGGGAPAREYQAAYRALAGDGHDERQDWVGIAATHLNGELIKQVFAGLAPDPVVADPTAAITFSGQVLVAAGWKPGFSHDYDAVLLAERYAARSIIKLSSVAQVYSADPRTDTSAKALERIEWSALQRLAGDVWTPGAHTPFDPIATRHAAKLRISLVVAGADLDNLRNILRNETFVGTTVGPD